jgi:hypothetical protein
MVMRMRIIITAMKVKADMGMNTGTTTVLTIRL